MLAVKSIHAKMFLLFVLHVLEPILVHSQLEKRTNMNKCKITHSGVEYAGDISHTESGIKCQEWKSIDSNYHVYDDFTDHDFPEGSKSRARNFCRNIKGRFKNPWCYTVNKDVNDEICNIPLCNFDCRMTLIGAEYGGNMNVSLTGRHCLQWSEKRYRKYLKKHTVVTSDRFLLDEKFPELSRKKASNYCRNPTSDPNGPWCLVEDDFLKTVNYEKEYCDVKFCSNFDCIAGTNRLKDKDSYAHFISLNDSNNLDFSILPWNIDLKNYTFRVAFSVFPLPLSGPKVLDIRNGIELVISNHGIGFVRTTGQEIRWKHIHNLLSGHQKKTFGVNWLYPRISVVNTGNPLFSPITADYDFLDNKGNNNIITNNKGQFSYYSIIGDAGLWDLPCYSKCREEITIQPYCNFYRKMNKTEDQFSTSFIVRSDQTVYIELRDSPNSEYPYFKIEILGTFNKTSVALVLNSTKTSEFFDCGTYTSILSYWSWTEFELTVVGDHLQLNWIRSSIPSETICNVEHVAVANAKWYSICSNGTAHWMFSCQRLDIPPLPDRKPPECAHNKKGETYQGTQWTSKSGQPCIPWIAEQLDTFVQGFAFGITNRKEMVNYCRNLISDDDGPFCYTADVDRLPNLVMKKEHCNVRICQMSQCKVTGLGKDYSGDINITRTNRDCKMWSEYNITNYWTLNNISVGNETYVKNLTENYCRNPNNHSFGPWCFTNDENVPFDLCDIRDCSLDDAFTLINNGTKSSSRIYIRPEWVVNGIFFSLKSWDPQIQVGVALNLSFEEGNDYFLLEIGADNNTKVKLSYVDEKGNFTLIKEKIITKLIPMGYWQGLWLTVPPIDMALGYHESNTPIFYWENPQDSEITHKDCKFISFSNLGDYLVGVNFFFDYCIVQQVYANFGDAFYPLNFGYPMSGAISKTIIHIRNDGNDSNGNKIKFFGESEFDFINLVMNSTVMSLSDESDFVLNQIKATFLSKSWISLTINYDESYITIHTNRNNLLRWNAPKTRILRLYYFTITAHNTTISWLSNCNPPSDHGPVIDGGWSEWGDFICSVRCGGGLGYRTRFCTNPAPNFKGKPCLGPNMNEGECNTFECGCINPETYQKINKTLESQALNKELKSGENAIFKCTRSVVEDIKLDSPGSYLQWLKNGYKITKDKLKFSEIQIEETNLELKNVKESDAGVYMCVIYPDCPAPNNVTFVPITIIALIVNSDQYEYARETTQYQMGCKGLILSFIYVDLSQYWELDNELMIDYTIKPLEEVDMDFISELDPSYEGTWTCKVRQNELNLTWTTNRFKLKVIDPPSLWGYLTLEDAPSIIFHGWNYALVALLLWSIVILEIAGVGYTAYWYWTTRQELLGLTDAKSGNSHVQSKPTK